MLDRVKSPITLVALVLLVVGALVVGLRLATEDIPPLGGTQDQAACQSRIFQPGDRLRATQVLVNVYNAGSVAGLAEKTQTSLVEKGFLPGSAGNAPQDLQTRTSMVLDADPHSAAVQLVKAQLKPPVKVKRMIDDLADGVDVVVGDDAAGVRKSGPLALTVDARTEVCVPTTPPTS